MKLKDLYKEAAVETKSESVRDVLSMMYNVIQKAEKSVGFGQVRRTKQRKSTFSKL